MADINNKKIETKHRSYMREALCEAEKARQKGEVPVGAVLVHEGAIIARAHNESITRNDPTAHAEITVIRKGTDVLKNYRLPKTVLYTTIEPCLMCFGACVWARVETIVFGASDPKVGSCGTAISLFDNPDINHKICVVGGVLEKECGAIIQNFFIKRR